MEELNNNTEPAVTGKKKTVIGRIFRGILWFAGIWAALLVVLQIILSSSFLVKAVDRISAEYIDGDLEFESIKVNMFRRFPNVAIIMENGSLTYPAERYDSLEAESVQGRMMYHGCGESSDTLASFRHFSASVNVAALLSGKVHIPHVAMVRPRIFAHSYANGEANWNMFRLPESEEDTTETVLPPIAVGRIRLVDHPHIVYTSSRDTLFTMIDVKRIAFNGKLNTRKTSRNRIGLTLDSMMVAGRMAADTIGIGLNRLYIHEHKDHMDILAEAKALLATRSFGRMRIPVSITGTAGIPKDTVPVIVMNGFKAEIAAIPIGFDMTVRLEDSPYLKGSFSVDGCRAEDMIDGFIKNIIPEAKNVKTDAVLSLSGTCEGYLGNGKLPAIDAVLSIPESSISHKDIKHDISLALEAGAKTARDGKINVSISNAALETYGLHLLAKGGASDIMGDDPLISVDGCLKVSADSLLTFLPEDSGIIAEGDLDLDLKGSIRMSQMDIYNFGLSDLEGQLASGKLILKSPKDTIDVNISDMSVALGPETIKSRRSDSEFRLLSLKGNIGKAEVSLKEVMKLTAEAIELTAKNSVDAMSEHDTTKVNPLSGRISAKELAVTDGEGMSLALDETKNTFRMFPKRDNPEIPVLSLSSANKRIYVRDKSNRIILTDANVKARAAMNSIERRNRFRAYMDSVALAHPEIPRDSLMSYLRAQRLSRTPRTAVPEWMTEEDFKSKDLNFSLDGMLADYFRKWDLNGSVDVRTGILMTPMLPLRNIIKGIDVNFSNNEVKIDTFSVITGSSRISARGGVTGLRRALLGRGIYKLDLELSSEKMDANELLAAINAGASIDTDNLDKDASDSDFLKMVVVDSLEKEDINTLLVVPANINAEMKVNAENITFSDLFINRFHADVVMKERCMQIVNAKAETNMGDASFEGFYATRSKKNINAGFNLDLKDITSEKVIAMMPAIDTIMPLLKSFKGQLDCEVAATTSLDTCMNVIMPSINGVIRIEGENLTMSDSKMFSSLAKKLKFKDNRQAKIDKMTVEGLIKDNTLEVFPFILELDRYTLGLSGLQNLDMSYKYHASIIHSPLLFKVGVDIYGPDFDNMKFRIGKPKYKSKKIPVFTTVIDQTRINLAESIHSIFEKGVELAVRENEMQKAIAEHKEEIGYVNAAEQQMEELNENEQKMLEEEQNRDDAPAQIDSSSISNTSDKIVLKEIQDNE